MTLAVVLIIAVALAFDFFNGFHDAANSIATVVSTRVLSPRQAVAWAAFFNFAAFLIFGTAVAATIANDVVNPAILDNQVIFAGLRRGDRVGRHHLVPRPAHQLVARPRRGHGRGCGRESRMGCVDLVRTPEDHRVHRALAAHRALAGLHDHGHGLLVVPSRRTCRPAPSAVPAHAAGVGGGVQPRPRRQRRPEDDGDHPRAPDRERRGAGGLRRAAVGGACPPTRRSDWGRSSAAGGSSTPWGRRSRSSRPPEA